MHATLTLLLACGAVAKAGKPTHNGTDFLKYPQDASGLLIVDKDDDGYPNLNLDRFQNNADACPTDGPFGSRVLPCTNQADVLTSGLNSSVQKHGNCACGKIGTKLKKGCYMCGITKIATQNHFSSHRPDSLKCPPMTRRQILERAIGWVVTGAAYRDNQDIPETCARKDPNPNCPEYMFQGVCNGFTDMAWYGSGSGCQEAIDCKDMLPGDKIHHKTHSMLWRKFVKDSSGKITHGIMYQMGGGWAKANVAVHPNKFTGKCFRRKNLLPDEDDALLASIDDSELVV